MTQLTSGERARGDMVVVVCVDAPDGHGIRTDLTLAVETWTTSPEVRWFYLGELVRYAAALAQAEGIDLETATWTGSIAR